MAVLPVLDLMQGQVVRGIAGQRDSYRPIVSQIAQSADPLDVATAMRTHFGFTQLYLADLDAIQGGRTAKDIYEQLQREGFGLWVDAGIRGPGDQALADLVQAGISRILVGLESVAGPEETQQIARLVGWDRTVFSLDLKSGQPLCRPEAWGNSDPITIAETVIRLGIRRLIVLDLARVGMGVGVGTEAFCRELKRMFPAVQIIAGGGVRDVDDVHVLSAAGVDDVLIASALHDGRLTRAEVLAC